MVQQDGGLSLSDLFNPRAAEAAYQRLIDVINLQSTHIRKLEVRVVELEQSRTQTGSAERKLDATLGQLQRSVQALEERDAHSKRHMQTMAERMASMQKELADRAVATQVAADLKRLEIHTTNMFNEVNVPACMQLYGQTERKEDQMHCNKISLV